MMSTRSEIRTVNPQDLSRYRDQLRADHGKTVKVLNRAEEALAKDSHSYASQTLTEGMVRHINLLRDYKTANESTRESITAELNKTASGAQQLKYKLTPSAETIQCGKSLGFGGWGDVLKNGLWVVTSPLANLIPEKYRFPTQMVGTVGLAASAEYTAVKAGQDRWTGHPAAYQAIRKTVESGIIPGAMATASKLAGNGSFDPRKTPYFLGLAAGSLVNAGVVGRSSAPKFEISSNPNHPRVPRGPKAGAQARQLSEFLKEVPDEIEFGPRLTRLQEVRDAIGQQPHALSSAANMHTDLVVPLSKTRDMLKGKSGLRHWSWPQLATGVLAVAGTAGPYIGSKHIKDPSLRSVAEISGSTFPYVGAQISGFIPNGIISSSHPKLAAVADHVVKKVPFLSAEYYGVQTWANDGNTAADRAKKTGELPLLSSTSTRLVGEALSAGITNGASKTLTGSRLRKHHLVGPVIIGATAAGSIIQDVVTSRKQQNTLRRQKKIGQIRDAARRQQKEEARRITGSNEPLKKGDSQTNSTMEALD
jgi:hypothetical protein